MGKEQDLSAVNLLKNGDSLNSLERMESDAIKERGVLNDVY